MYNIQITTELQGWLHKFCGSVQNENSEPFVQKAKKKKKKKVPLKLLKYKTFSFIPANPLPTCYGAFYLQINFA